MSTNDIKFNLPYVPDQTSYSIDATNDTIYVMLDGGAPWIKRTILNSWRIVNVAWTLNEHQYNVLERFFRSVGTFLAGTVFNAELIINDSEIKGYNALFVPQTFKLSKVNALTFTVNAKLFVEPLQYDEEYEIGLIVIEDGYGTQEAGEEAINLLHILVNIKIPIGTQV